VDLPLRQTLFDAVGFLESQRLAYALIGGLAVSLRGQPRLTADVDIVIKADLDGALELSRNLEHSPFRALFGDVEDVIVKSFLLPLRHRTTNVKVDVAIGMTGFEHEIVARAKTLLVGDCNIAVASAEDLLIMKVLAGRPQDEQDLQGLVVVQGETLDWEYCMQMAKNLGEAVGQDLTSRVRALRESQDIG
jgi:hypothetical protein